VPDVAEYRLVQVADLHLGVGHGHHLDNWRKVAAWIGRERPDTVVVNGDLLMNDPDDERDHAFARDELRKLGMPCRFLPGNHDVGDNVVSGKMAQRVDDARCERFVRFFGEERWAFEQAGWGFVGVNAQLFGSNGLAREAEQWAFLESRLAALRGQPIALFVHKPLFLDHPGEGEHEDPLKRQGCLDATSRLRLDDLIRANGVRLVSSGHKHQTRSFSLDGTYYLWAPSTACVNGGPASLHWGTREVGFIDYRFRPDGFDHRIVGADFLFRHENYVRKLAAGVGS
jgi:3',5'-cyclic AMP phosphodiesterase CpdA